MQPYPGVDIANVYERLQAGIRLERPDKCPRDCYAVIKSCWDLDDNRRPSFAKLFETLQSMVDRYLRENQMGRNPYMPQPPPNFSNHPSVKGDPTSRHCSKFEIRIISRPLI